MSNGPTQRMIRGAAGPLNVLLDGDNNAPAVVMTHSLLASSMMWESQVPLLLARGFRVIRIDLRGHGDSPATAAPYTMDGLAADTICVLDSLGIAGAHYVGLSIGGMSGFGLGLRHADRLSSLCLCDARADAPAAFAAQWDERIGIARGAASCEPLAAPTIERWFGKPFLDTHPALAERFVQVAANTRVEGFIGCARAIQGLDYLAHVSRIATPCTLIVGANDGVLPQAMSDLQAAMPNAVLESIAAAGHLPNIDQPEAFDAALARHFDRVRAA